ncbi:unnamed protein product, partial [Fusarium graminearum]
ALRCCSSVRIEAAEDVLKGSNGQGLCCSIGQQRSGRDRFNLVQSQSALHFTSNDVISVLYACSIWITSLLLTPQQRKDQQKKLNGSKLASAKLRYFGLGMSFLIPE